MIKIDEKGFNYLRSTGVTAVGETKEDFSVRLELSDCLDKKLISNNEELEAKIHELFGELGIKSTDEDVSRIKNTIVLKRKSKLVGDIQDCERIIKYQTSGGFKEKLEASREELERLENDPDSFFEGLFKQKSK